MYQVCLNQKIVRVAILTSEKKKQKTDFRTKKIIKHKKEHCHDNRGQFS